MYILHIASELAPIAKAGGLADVVYGLAQETKNQGHQVEVLIPKYDCIDYSLLKNLKPAFLDLWSYEGPYRFHNTVWSAEVNNLKTLLLEPHHPAYFFSRGKIYNCEDDMARFIYFSRAALEYVYKSGKRPDVIHLHDWPTSLVAVLQKEMYILLHLHIKKIVITIHNLAYQGKCLPQLVTASGLRGEELLLPAKLQDPLYPTLLNLLKGGILYSDAITTVSPSYEKEIQTPEGGENLDKILVQNRQKLHGILNGIDPHYWNPQIDPYLPFKYSLENQSEGKKKNKTYLRKKLDMPPLKSPLICAITRLAAQKSPELIKFFLEQSLEEGAQFVLVGSATTPEIEQSFKSLQQKWAKNKNVSIHLVYNEELAHLTFAAADMIVIPSRFEPCGLTQMIALRYGTLPIVRKTGGLADTVFEEKNGFTFSSLEEKEAKTTLKKALSYFSQKPKAWEAMIQYGMQTDFSWKHSVKKYLEIYTD